MTKSELFQTFWGLRPALNLSRFSEEAKVGRTTLIEILEGAEPRASTWEKLLPVMRRYGFYSVNPLKLKAVIKQM